jgi:oligopeptide/dipeptide ABC transporter ATP-binding protein
MPRQVEHVLTDPGFYRVGIPGLQGLDDVGVGVPNCGNRAMNSLISGSPADPEVLGQGALVQPAVFIAAVIDRHVSDGLPRDVIGPRGQRGPGGHGPGVASVTAVPVPGPRQERAKKPAVIRGELPSAPHPPSGCRFRTRCPRAADRSAAEEPLPVVSGTVTWRPATSR